MISRITFCSAQPRNDPCGALGRQIPLTSRETLRLLLDEIEHRLSEPSHQPLGVDRADAADHSRSEIPLDALQRRRQAGAGRNARNCCPWFVRSPRHPLIWTNSPAH